MLFPGDAVQLLAQICVIGEPAPFDAVPREKQPLLHDAVAAEPMRQVGQVAQDVRCPFSA